AAGDETACGVVGEVVAGRADVGAGDVDVGGQARGGEGVRGLGDRGAGLGGGDGGEAAGPVVGAVLGLGVGQRGHGEVAGRVPGVCSGLAVGQHRGGAAVVVVGVGDRVAVGVLAGKHLPGGVVGVGEARSEEHTSELQSRENLVCRLLLEIKNSIEIV